MNMLNKDFKLAAAIINKRIYTTYNSKDKFGSLLLPFIFLSLIHSWWTNATGVGWGMERKENIPEIKTWFYFLILSLTNLLYKYICIIYTIYKVH